MFPLINPLLLAAAGSASASSGGYTHWKMSWYDMNPSLQELTAIATFEMRESVGGSNVAVAANISSYLRTGATFSGGASDNETKAFDADHTTYYHGDGTPGLHEIGVVFSAPRNIRQIALRSRLGQPSTGPRAIMFWASNDGTTWRLVGYKTFGGWADGVEQLYTLQPYAIGSGALSNPSFVGSLSPWSGSGGWSWDASNKAKGTFASDSLSQAGALTASQLYMVDVEDITTTGTGAELRFRSTSGGTTLRKFGIKTCSGTNWRGIFQQAAGSSDCFCQAEAAQFDGTIGLIQYYPLTPEAW